MTNDKMEPAPAETWLVIWWVVAFLLVVLFTLVSYFSGFFFTPR